MISGTWNQSCPVSMIVARSVAPTPVPIAPIAPWVVVCESVATMMSPGQITPRSIMT